MREFPDLNYNFKGGDFGGYNRWSGFSSKAFGVTKFILGICLLPFVYSATVSFLKEFSAVDAGLRGNFLWGIVTFLLIYLFVWEPAIIYTRGHKLLEWIFNFFKPLVKVAPYVFPIYALILFILYQLLALFIRAPWLAEYAVFLFGFTLALHLIFSANSVRGKKGDFLKANYIFGFSLVYIINLGLFALFFSAIFEKFSFVGFCNSSYQISAEIIGAVFRQLFL
ncbi:MAG: hypothetical protein Q8N85_05095 [Candidatus Omnitrophota bacterium]|nr:hypothetical protein [Candidatus Omnitrophota bacterium]